MDGADGADDTRFTRTLTEEDDGGAEEGRVGFLLQKTIHSP